MADTSLRLPELVRSRIADPAAGEDGGDWCCRLAPEDRGGAALYELAREHRRIHVVRVEGARCADLPEALETLANALEFPGYYGRNTDAFWECLRDLLDLSSGGMGSAFGLPGRSADALVLLVRGAERFLADASDRNASVLLSQLASAATEEHSGEQAEFFVAFACVEGLPAAVTRFHRDPGGRS